MSIKSTQSFSKASQAVFLKMYEHLFQAIYIECMSLSSATGLQQQSMSIRPRHS